MSEDVQIYRMDHPSMLEIPQVAQLFEEAFAKTEYVDLGQLVKWIMENAASPEVAIMLARHGETLSGLAICTAFINAWSPTPWVLYIYAPKDKPVRIALAAEIRRWMRSLGYETIRAVNRSGIDDGVYRLLFEPVGKGEVIGSLVEFTAQPEESE